MTLPNLSNSMYVAYLRNIQSIHEPRERRNPDTMARYFLPMVMRFRATWLSRADLAELRADPFYYYLIARTRYYDQVITDAVSEGIKLIVGVGAGSDTRAYRFRDLLLREGVTVLECDQPESIHTKQEIAKRWRRSGYVDHMPIDLNDGTWPELERRIGDRASSKTLVLMEGVSPYVNDLEFRRFLQFLSGRLAAGSSVAYDFKLAGFRDEFGSGGGPKSPFACRHRWMRSLPFTKSKAFG